METPSNAHHLDALTGVRAFAALWVFVFHSWLNSGSPAIHLPILAQSIDLTPLATFGWLGLDVFFILSGFLLTRQAFLKSARGEAANSRSRFVGAFGEKYSRYLRRRILRVYPAYYACITVLLILAAAGVYQRLPGKVELLLHLGMMHNFIEKYIATMNGVFWTMPFEWQFYLVFPLLFVLLRHYGAWALYGTALVSVLCSKLLVIAIQDGYPQVLLFIRSDEFAAGMCAGAYAFQRPLTRSTAAMMFWGGLIALLATPWIFAGYTQVGHYYDLKGFLRPPWIQVGICLMLLGLTGERHAGVHVFGNKITVGIGLISYSIYLLHVPIIELLPTLGLIPDRANGGTVAWPRIVVTALPLILLLSALSYWFIERPFQKVGKASPLIAKPQGSGVAVNPILLLGVWAICLELFLFIHHE